MKTFLTLATLLLYLYSSAQQKDINLASCCDTERGCTGSSYCTACSNCSGCKHCAKNGGSCGVCSSGRPKSYSSPKPKKKSSTSTKKSSGSAGTSSSAGSSSHYPQSALFFSSGDYLYVTINELNVRKESNSKSAILEKVKLNDKLKYIKTEGSWYKVEVAASRTIGYVYYKYVK